METLQQRWDVFRRGLTPYEQLDGKTQRLLRSAWYAGAAAMYEAVLDATAPADEASGEANLKALHAELLAYASDLRNLSAGTLTPGGHA